MLCREITDLEKDAQAKEINKKKCGWYCYLHCSELVGKALDKVHNLCPETAIISAWS